MNFLAKAIERLRAARQPLQAQLDAIDLAIENLARVSSFSGYANTSVSKPKEAAAGGPRRPARKTSGSDAGGRREVLLNLISKSAAGLTHAELRKHTRKMSQAERSNALNVLRVAGEIERKGNTWCRPAPGSE